jgi:hypothetical protein
MKYILLIILIFFSCNNQVERGFKKMQRKKDRKERIERRMKMDSEIDTTHFRWFPLSDSSIIGTPKILK